MSSNSNNNMFLDDAFSSMIKSNFPFLESLTLMINWCSVKILDIRCLTLRTLRLHFDLDNQIKVQVYAPNLPFYTHESTTLPPSLLFPISPPQKIELSLQLNESIDEEFFLKMREALELSSKFNVTIFSSCGVLVPFDIDDVKTILLFLATSVEELVFIKQFDNAFWENSLLFDAVFSICHPIYVKANNELNLKVASYLLNQLMVKENEIGKVVYSEIRNPLNGRWAALTSSSLSLLDTTTLRDCSDPLKLTEFKLSWSSP
ncbi:hypothetical protein Tco_0942252 [Tanacetum coccineum]